MQILQMFFVSYIRQPHVSYIRQPHEATHCPSMTQYFLVESLTGLGAPKSSDPSAEDNENESQHLCVGHGTLTRPAKYFCVQCLVMVCENCHRVHHRQHKITNIEPVRLGDNQGMCKAMYMYLCIYLCLVCLCICFVYVYVYVYECIKLCLYMCVYYVYVYVYKHISIYVSSMYSLCIHMYMPMFQ